MIKDLPDQWYVYVPTEQVACMVWAKLVSCGYRQGSSFTDYDGSHIIFSLYGSPEIFSNFSSKDIFFCPKEEITLRAILEGEAEQVKEKSLDEKMDECFLHLSTRCATDLKSYLKAFAKLILDECKK